jgi:non-heme chloroperoxidase
VSCVNWVMTPASRAITNCGVSGQAWQNSFYVAISASARAALRYVTACLEDFRGDRATISIPVLIIHGDQDRVLPYEATSRRLPALLKNAQSRAQNGRAG